MSNIHTDKLRDKLIEFFRSGPTEYTVQKRTGIDRSIIIRFVKKRALSITYENGIILRHFLNEWEQTYGKKEKRVGINDGGLPDQGIKEL